MDELLNGRSKWIRAFLYPFMLTAALGFCLSLVAHIVSICGLTIPNAL